MHLGKYQTNFHYKFQFPHHLDLSRASDMNYNLFRSTYTNLLMSQIEVYLNYKEYTIYYILITYIHKIILFYIMYKHFI